uniref:Uncharacterized protein n=1 Tax=Grammatophora oceanica TaxID=210454 RepID=A0A7S1V4E0_9STRA|mmetsp:Transcript_36133/g.53891  ORF Transcript_36133/g.53891 Transcript_36133/m.53891 type:complete len:505 (+) Transcript_36133:392-1906(+)|eukprot:CAMPEP_0194031230 /NCGR_PEP_ID=MMETSP0009_2-20130614/4448_1 /TAXON_ID=210454 /ORGANISM="Grammatophora oceanica, Strain CCMP 410" /LENGTH=504 /DNA_ID=CAMNT_0038671323 /DNA_START=343 /DNA_END=1857 /DNA_ORIENTATION=-
MVIKSINSDDDTEQHDLEAATASALEDDLPPPVAPPRDEAINKTYEEVDEDIVFEPQADEESGIEIVAAAVAEGDEPPVVMTGYVDCHLCYAEGRGEVACSEHHFFCTFCIQTHLQKALRIGGMFETNVKNKDGTLVSEPGQVPCPLFFSQEDKCTCTALSEEVFHQYADPILWRRALERIRHSAAVREADDTFSKKEESPSHRSDSSETLLMSDRFVNKDEEREDLVKKLLVLTVSFLFVALMILSMMLPTLLGRFVSASLLTALVTWLGTHMLCLLVDSNAEQEVGCVHEVVLIGTPIEEPYLSAEGRWAPYRTMLGWTLLATTGYGLLLTFWPEPNAYRWVQPIGPCLLLWVALNFGGGMVVVNWSRPRRGSFHWQYVRMLTWSAVVLPVGVYWVLYDDGFFSTWGWRGGVIATTYASLFLGAETYVLALAAQARWPTDLLRSYVCAFFWASGILLVFLMGDSKATTHAGLAFGSIFLVLPFVLMIAWCCRDRRRSETVEE